MNARPGTSAFGFLAVFGFALLVRAAYLYSQAENPFSSYPLSDSMTYIMDAERILGGDWLGKQVFTFGGGAFYPYFLAVLFAVFGKNYLAVQAAQCLMGAASSGVIYLIGQRLYGTGVGLATGLWAALFAPFLFHEGLMLSSAPAILFLSLSLYCLLLSFDSGKPGRALLAGLFLGLSALNRPNVLLLAPVYFLWTVIAGPNPSLKKAAPYALVLGTLMVLLPVTLRNYKVGDDFVLISSGGGFSFFLGNNPAAPGILDVPMGLGISNDANIYSSAHALAEQRSGKRLKPSEGSRFWFRLGTEFLKDSPGKAASLYLKKLHLFWSELEITNIYKYGFFRNYSPVLLGPLQGFGMLAVMGLLGAFWMLFSGTKEEKLLPALLFAYMLSVVPFFISSKLRVPVSVFLFPCAGYALKRLTIAGGLRTRTAAAALSVILFLFVYRGMDDEIRKASESNAFAYLHLATRAVNSGDYARAMEFYDRVLEDRPEALTVAADAARVAEKTGDIERARELYGGILARLGLPPSDGRAVTFSWSNPYSMAGYRALLRLGIIRFNEGDYVGAEELLKPAAIGYPMGLPAHRYLAMSYEKQGKLKQALDEYETSLRILPRDANIRRKVLELRSRPH
ncbi:MAG: glycosyltransferase family 39 protein [Thermodesulfobacteriota bacterium]